MGLNPAGVTMKVFFQNTKPFGQLLTLVVAVVLSFIIASGVVLVAASCGADILAPRHQLWQQGVIQLITFLLPALVYAWLFSDSPTQFLKLGGSRRLPVQILAAVMVLLLVTPFVDWLTTINDNWHWGGALAPLEERLRADGARSEALVAQLLQFDAPGSFWYLLVVLALIPALCEEFLFRGAVQQSLHRCLCNPHAAILLTAVIFSLAHGEFFSFLPRFVLGLLLGYLFYYGCSIWVNVVAHFINNAIVVIFSVLYYRGQIEFNPTEDIAAPWYLVVLGMVLAAALFWVIFLRRISENHTSSSAELQG